MNPFEPLGVAPTLVRGLNDLRFRQPFPIQQEAIPPLLQGRDVIGQAHTGTGKTAAFGLPLLQRVDPRRSQIQGFVLAPTRELALQVADDLRKMGKHTGVRVIEVYGGRSLEQQARALRQGPHIVVGTPGRVIDHLRRGSLNLRAVRFVILDEADRMLDMGFIDDVEFILKHLPPDRQTALFSATMPEAVRRLARRHLVDPLQIMVDTQEITLDTIRQQYLLVERPFKVAALTRLLRERRIERALVFCATKRSTDALASQLRRDGLHAGAIHGDLSQAERETALRRFREGMMNVLVATDVAARGLDIQDVSHVINFDLPEDPLIYFHRIGRTARAGASGEAITLVTPQEMMLLDLIQRETSLPIHRIPTPSALEPIPLQIRRRPLARFQRRNNIRGRW